MEQLTLEQARLKFALRMGDNALILGQRISEWCGHGPVLEQDIALSNMALDQIGQARLWLQLAARYTGNGATEDSLAYFRTEREFLNAQLVELPNGDWAKTLMRQFLYDTFNYFLQDQLVASANPDFAAIAEKARKEVAYHAQWSAEWIIRFGDGTEESHQRVAKALDDLWPYTGGLFYSDQVEQLLQAAGEVPNLEAIQQEWLVKVKEVLDLATLTMPEVGWMHQGGKKGLHTEHMGFILAEMQSLPRTYPDAQW